MLHSGSCATCYLCYHGHSPSTPVLFKTVQCCNKSGLCSSSPPPNVPLNVPLHGAFTSIILSSSKLVNGSLLIDDGHSRCCDQSYHRVLGTCNEREWPWLFISVGRIPWGSLSEAALRAAACANRKLEAVVSCYNRGFLKYITAR